jgi:hypothetical protein
MTKKKAITEDLDPHPTDPDRLKNGSFKPGVAPKVRRRTGTRNKITRDIKERIITGAEEYGEDGKGKGGLQGYLKMCARKYPKQYMLLLGKLLPFNITADKNIGSIGSINIVTAPSGQFLSMDQIRELNGLPPLIAAHEPQHVIEEKTEPDFSFANVRRLNPYNKDEK